METQQQPTLVQIYDWHTPDFTYEAEDEDPAQITLDSPPSTIPFDEDSLPRQLPSERLPPSEEVGEAAGSPSPFIEISDDEEDNHARPRRQNAGRPDYTYRQYHEVMEHATTISSNPRKRKREESNTVDLSSELDRLVKSIRRRYEISEQENSRLQEENLQLKQENTQLKKAKKHYKEQVRTSNLRIDAFRRQIDEQKKRGVLSCAGCRSTKENWKILGCRHLLCTQCAEDVRSQAPLFGYPCPQCKTPIESCLDCFPNLLEV